MGIRAPASLRLRVVLWVLAIAAFGAVTYWRISQRVDPKDSDETQDLNASMEASADRAVEMAKTYAVSLDYSAASIDRLDSLLGTIRKDYSGPKSDFELGVIATMFGAYAGEVIRRGAPGAYWGKDHPTAGASTYPLYFGTGSSCCFPVGWCRGRLLGDERNSIARQFRAAEAAGRL